MCLAFSRESFLRSLDRFYRAIEDAAHGLDDFTEKPHFLNALYERFFQGYSVKVADTHGIVYTLQAIVDFTYASFAEVLQREFVLSLGSSDLRILSFECNRFVTMQSHPSFFFGVMVQDRETLIEESPLFWSTLRGLCHVLETEHTADSGVERTLLSQFTRLVV
jgi:hypothetical protein